MNKRIKKIAFLGILTSFAMILSYLELLLPPISTAFPGIKMGLPNIIIIFTMYRFGIKEAITVSFLRVVCVTFLFGSVMTFAYSALGALLSICVMFLLKKLDLFSSVGVSVVGGISHNAGQILVAVLIFKAPQIAYYMIPLTISGTVAGLLVGLVASYSLKLTQKYKFSE